jgi:Concanavalin A-like lectin/glucanases superfamily/Bacterial Ig domain
MTQYDVVKASLTGLFLCLLLALAGNTVAFGQSDSLTLTSSSATPGSSVSLNLSLTSPSGSEPAGLQWTFSYPTSSLSAISVTAGSAATGAGKSIACAGGSGTYTCMLVGMNSTVMPNGVVAVANLTLSATATNTSVGVTGSQGVSVAGYPITITGTGGTITVTALSLSSLSCSPLTVGSAGISTCTVTLNQAAPSGGTTVTLTNSDSSAFSVPSSVTVAAGATTATFSATAATSTTTKSSTITASLNGGSKSVSLTLQPSSSPTSLISAYSLNEDSGNTISDISGNSNTGTINGATWTTSGKYGSALAFNGSSNYVDLGNPASLQLTGSMTASAWIYAKANPPDDGQIISKSDDTDGWQIKTTPDTGVRTFGFAISNGGSHIQRNSKTVLSLNTWYYVTGVYNAAAQTLDIYVNGVLDNGVLSGTVPSSQLNSTQNVRIGMRSSGYYFNGTIDEVRVYNTALTQAAIQSDMSTPVGGGGVVTPTLTSLQCSPTALSSGASSTCTVRLSVAAPSNTVVTLSDNSALLTSPASVTVAAGASSATFTVTAGTLTTNQSATVTATLGTDSSSVSLTLQAPVLLTGLTCSPTNLGPGSASTCTVTLNQTAPSSTAVSLSDNSSVLTTPASVTVASGASSATFTVTAGTFTSSQSASVTATLGTSSVSASLSLQASTLLTGLTCSPTTLAPGATSTCTVTLNQAAPSSTAVSLSDNSNVLTTPASVTVASGASSATFTVTAGSFTSSQSASVTATLGTSSFSASLTLQPSSSPAGLVSSFSFSEGSGSTVSDSSGDGVTGTINGATWTTTGKYGSALSFNGSSNYVDLGNPASLQLTGSMTASAWVYPTANPGDDGQIIAKSADTDGWQLKTTPDTGVRTFGFSISNGGAHIQRNSKTVLSLNTWYYVTGVYNAAAQTLDIYVNGVLDDGILSGTVPSSQSNSTQNVRIGMRYGGYYFNGTIDEVRVYNTALTQAAIQSDMGTPVGGGGVVTPTLTSLQCSPTTISSGASSTCTVGLSAAAPSNTVVTLSSNNALLVVPASVTVAAGSSTASFPAGAGTLTTNQSATVTAKVGTGSSSVSLTLQAPAPMLLTGLTCSPTTLVSGAASTCTVRLSAAAPSNTVVALSDNSALLASPASVTVAAGASSASFTVTAGTPTTSQSATLTATLGTSSFSASLTLQAPVLLSGLSCSPTALASGATAVCTVALNQAAPGATVVSLSDNSALLTTPASVTVAANGTSATFSVTAGTVTANATAVITATLGSSSTTFSLGLSAPAVLSSLTCTPTGLTTGSSSTCTVTLAATTTTSVVVATSSSNTSVLSTPSSVSVAAGSASATFSVAAKAAGWSIVSAQLDAVAKHLVITTKAAKNTSSVSAISCGSARLAVKSTTRCTVSLAEAAPAGGTAVQLNADTKAVSLPSTLQVAEGSTSATFTLQAQVTDQDQTSTIMAATSEGSQATQVSVEGVKPVSLSCAPRTVQAGATAICEVHLNSNEIGDSLRLDLSSSSQSLRVPATLTTRPNQSSLRFQASAAATARQESASIQVVFGSNLVQETLLLQPSNAPVLELPGDQIAKTGTPVSFTVTAADATGSPISLQASGLPEDALFDAATGRFTWKPSEAQAGSHEVTFTATDSLGTSATGKVAIAVDSGKPVVTELVNGATQTSDLVCSPGAVASLHGRWLTADDSTWHDLTGSALQLGGTQVEVNGTPTSVLYASRTRVDFLCPDASPGTPLQVGLKTESGSAKPVSTTMLDAAPGVFTWDGSGRGQAEITFANGTDLATVRSYQVEGQPAQTGDHLTIRVTGLPTGNSAAQPLVRVGDVYAEVEFVRPVPGMAGVSDIGVTLPTTSLLGNDVPILIQLPRATGRLTGSNVATMAIEAVQE